MLMEVEHLTNEANSLSQIKVMDLTSEVETCDVDVAPFQGNAMTVNEMRYETLFQD
jgi:hypothetical protein